MNLVDTLNSKFGIPEHLHFKDGGADLPVAIIDTRHAKAAVALQGGQVLTWQPVGQQPVLWVSEAAVFEVGKGVRGGVPVCWPWFGALAGKSAHGFVRTRMWQLRAAELDASGQVQLRLGLSDDAATRAIWDFAFDLELTVMVGPTLSMALTTRNTGTGAFAISEALHTYFGTGDIAQTGVHGLDGCHYLDKVNAGVLAQQSGAVQFTGETDRVYQDTATDCVIEDTAWGRSIRLAKQNSSATVVWNPWAEREKAFADMASGEYRNMLCVEAANAPAPVSLAAGETHTLGMVISLA
jgi:glucose-6-phosphate 1-epimerase